MKELRASGDLILRMQAVKQRIDDGNEQVTTLRMGRDAEIALVTERYESYVREVTNMISAGYEESRKLDEECTHDFVICLGKDYLLDESPLPMCKCLTCGIRFRLGEDEDIKVQESDVIDVRGLVPEEDIITVCGQENIVVHQAQQKLMELYQSGADLAKEEVKKIILEDLVNNREARKSRRRVM